MTSMPHITSDILRAIDSESVAFEWKQNGFRAMLSRLSTSASALCVDWDAGAGEEVASVTANGELVAYVFRELPLAFVISSALPLLREALSASRLVVISLNDFYLNDITVDYDVASRAFGSFADRIEPGECNTLSANDLWYAAIWS